MHSMKVLQFLEQYEKIDWTKWNGKRSHWYCQKVLPLVYDNSLSYYEMLCKLGNLVDKIGEELDLVHTLIDGMIEDINTIAETVNGLITEVNALQEEIRSVKETLQTHIDDFNRFRELANVKFEEIEQNIETIIRNHNSLVETVNNNYRHFEERINSIQQTISTTFTQMETELQDYVREQIGNINWEHEINVVLNEWQQNGKIEAFNAPNWLYMKKVTVIGDASIDENTPLRYELDKWCDTSYWTNTDLCLNNNDNNYGNLVYMAEYARLNGKLEWADVILVVLQSGRDLLSFNNWVYVEEDTKRATVTPLDGNPVFQSLEKFREKVEPYGKKVVFVLPSFLWYPDYEAGIPSNTYLQSQQFYNDTLISFCERCNMNYINMYNLLPFREGNYAKYLTTDNRNVYCVPNEQGSKYFVESLMGSNFNNGICEGARFTDCTNAFNPPFTKPIYNNDKMFWNLTKGCTYKASQITTKSPGDSFCIAVETETLARVHMHFVPFCYTGKNNECENYNKINVWVIKDGGGYNKVVGRMAKEHLSQLSLEPITVCDFYFDVPQGDYYIAFQTPTGEDKPVIILADIRVEVANGMIRPKTWNTKTVQGGLYDGNHYDSATGNRDTWDWWEVRFDFESDYPRVYGRGFSPKKAIAKNTDIATTIGDGVNLCSPAYFYAIDTTTGEMHTLVFNATGRGRLTTLSDLPAGTDREYVLIPHGSYSTFGVAPLIKKLYGENATTWYSNVQHPEKADGQQVT